MYTDFDRAWSAYCVTLTILGVICLTQTALRTPREAWADAFATDAQGYQIDLPSSSPQSTADGRD
jgi:hypothetical protein